MSSPAGFRLTQGVYYLCLGAWFGAMVMLVIAAVSAFAVVRGFEPALEAEAVGRLAGGVVGQSLKGLAVLQMVCAAGALGCAALQCTLFRDRLRRGVTGWANLLRLGLIVAAVGVLAVELAVIEPGVWAARTVMYDASQPEAVRAEARATFDRGHAMSERAGGAVALLAAAAVLASPFAFGGREDI